MGLALARLQEIDEVAAACREQALAAAAAFTFSNASAFNLVTLVAGPVRLEANLTRDGERLAGALDLHGPVPIIWCEAYDPSPRQFFSAAHELGHLVLHEPTRLHWQPACAQGTVDQDYPADQAASPQREEEADAFAAAFLIPAADLRRDIDTFGWSAAFHAERFGVSEAAMRRRQRVLTAIGALATA